MIIPKVLIVNDNRNSLTAYKSILTENPETEYEVLTAESGSEALRMVLKHEFAVVLLDVNMPIMDGFATAELIHSNPRLASLPIIFLTAHVADELNRLRGYEKGAADYIFTPVIPKILKAKVAVFVNLAKEKIELKRQRDELSRLNREMQLQRVRDLERLNAELQRENAERKEAEQKAYEISLRDPLTGLINRRPLIEYVENAIAYCARYHQHFALVLVDLVKFKEINHKLGHDVGDEVLIQIAERISDTVREVDTVARLGGDEFVVLLIRIGTLAEATLVANKIIQAVEHPILTSAQQLQITASVGVAIYPHDGQTAHDLLKSCDLSLNQQKHQNLRTNID
jgi:diguanylate cyclase (GGDEF)-like protein